MAFFPAIVEITDENGVRVDRPDVAGNQAPVRLVVGSNLQATSSTNGGLTEVRLDASGSGSDLALANHAAFRALALGDLIDNQVIHFTSPPGTYVYDEDTGAGIADDDSNILRNTNVLLAQNGRAYNVNTSAILPTIAALRLATWSTQSTIHVQNFSTIADGGGGLFDYDSTDTTSADDGGIIIVAGTRRYKRRYSGAVHSEWFGVKFDGIKITDGIFTAGSNIMETSGAHFTPAMVGRSALVWTPTQPVTGTVTTVAGSLAVTGSGTAFLTDIPQLPIGGGVAMSGGGVYINGDWVAINVVIDDTTLLMATPPSHSASGQTLYSEVQIATTVVSVPDTSHVVLNINGADILVSHSGTRAFIATDDTAARLAAYNAAGDRHTTVIEPAGFSGQSDNLYIHAKTGLTIEGQGWDKTILVDLRLSSFETLLVDRTVDNYGALSFVACVGITVRGLSYDGSVSVLGIQHTTGGVANNSGGRAGFMARNTHDFTVERCGSGLDGAYGARDEHLYCDSQFWTTGRNFRALDNVFLITNNNSINPGGMGEGCLIRGNHCSSFYSCLQVAVIGGIVCDNVWSGRPDLIPGGTGADPVVIEPLTGSNLIYCNNLHENFDTQHYGAAVVTLFGNPGPADALSSVEMHGNQYINCKGLFYTYAGVIHSISMPGTLKIHDEFFDTPTATSTGGMFINLSGATHGPATISSCSFRGRAGSNMTRAVVVEADVPAGKVKDGEGHTYGESVTTRWDVLANLAATKELVTI